MSGHSKWSTIKHKKAATDAKRSKIWTKIIKEITVAARMGGGDASGNPRLRAAVDKARAANMPNDNVQRAIRKGTGEEGGVHYEELSYEAYGPGGVALLIDIMTDSRNRTAAEIRHVLERHNGKLAAVGAVAYLFKKHGVLAFEGASEDALTELAIDLGADDVRASPTTIEVITDPHDFEKIRDGFIAKGFKPTHAEVQMVPSTTVRIEGKDAESMVKLLSALEDHDDVQNVHANFDIDDKVLEQLSA
ncbi:MAG TPA: YebC/PmpR family DNA-binding transcriptional regulator [Polyangia bacterium]|nr:YebC/PmpR family DNA-binding transcriptional regulator [Polyangia bacterium]